MEKSQEKLVIVAFGDSLTVGFQSPTITQPWYQETPYAHFLEERFLQPIKIIVKGISGELTDEMLRRFNNDVIFNAPDYVVILGGSNDLGWGIKPQSVIENLVSMYNTALSHDIKPVAVTVPSIRGFDDLIPARRQLNALIQENAERLNILCVDMFTASAEPETLRLSDTYSNDGLHLTTEGYKLLADILYDNVFNLIDK